MRRMLDPKEVGGLGGGGDGKLYCHCINFRGSWAQEKAGNIYFNYYSRSNETITFAELADYFVGHTSSCSGYVSVGSGPTRKYYNVINLSAARNKSIAVNYIIPEESKQNYAIITNWEMSETIAEVK